ncbi:MATE family efflux transporter [Streptomyces sp. NPDC050738]|uniref:MATE family efflux transporter n=1 Tax=Streptomyces sp. NPDC050738 TaxID=3154744 RepID=UPI003420F466
MINTGVSAVLGLGFWLAAAHYYSASAVGQGSAAIAAMKFLAGITAVTLTGALARFIPVAGKSTGALIFRTYAGSSAVVGVAAVIFLLTLDVWGPSYRFLHEPVNKLGFVVAVVAWSLLTLQDGVLTGLRSAFWVPVGNTVFSAVKLLLLVAIAVALPTTGVFVSWVAAIAASVLPLGWLVFRRLVPRHVELTAETADPPSYRELGRFLAGDYTGSLFALAVVYLIPVIVASQISSADNAYFYIAATIGGTVELLAINMGASLTVEGAHDPARLGRNARAALLRMVKIVVPIVLFLFVLAPHILHVFGEGYSSRATPLLRWLVVGALLRVVIELYFAVLRAQSRTAPLAYLQGGLCVLVLGSTLALLGPMGLTGVGVAEVASLAVITSIAAFRLYGVLRLAPAGEAADGQPEPEPGKESGEQASVRSEVLVNGTPAGGVRLDFDHLERRPDVDDRRPTWAQRELPTGRGSRPAPGDGPRVSSPYPRSRRHTGTDGPAEPPEPERPASNSRPPARPFALTEHIPELGVGLLLLAALALYWVPATTVGASDLDRMTGLGLISVLPAATLIGAGLLVLSFASLLWLDRPRTALLTSSLLATVVSLHALPAVLESQPRLGGAWQHLGLLDHIGRTGSVSPHLDTHSSWPGFYSAAAFLAEACGVSDLSAVLRWWPTVFQLLCLIPLFLLLRMVRAGWKAKWTGAWFFALSGWAGQDYFSPLSLSLLLYPAFLAVLLTWFRSPRTWALRRGSGESEALPAGRREKTVLLGVLLAVLLALVTVHPLAPVVLCAVVTGLVLVRRCELRGLPLLIGVLAAAWTVLLSEPYWSGAPAKLFAGPGSPVPDSLWGSAGDSGHQLVLGARLFLAGGILALAVWGWWRRRFAGYAERSLLVLAFVPLPGLLLQSYGGQLDLRIWTFALPGLAILAALALFPRAGITADERERDRASLAPLAALLAGLLLVGGFLVARWGGESYERVPPGEVAAMEYVYAHDTPSVRLILLVDTPGDSRPTLPGGAKDLEKVSYVPTRAPHDPVLVDGLIGALRGAGPRAYLVVNRSQVEYLRVADGYSSTWQPRLQRTLDARPELRRALTNDDVTLYELTGRPAPLAAAASASPGPGWPHFTWSGWPLMGAESALALIALLLARELLRVYAVPGPRALYRMRTLHRISLPLVLVLLGALVQRVIHFTS